jgi:hypothetical protein
MSKVRSKSLSRALFRARPVRVLAVCCALALNSGAVIAADLLQG